MLGWSAALAGLRAGLGNTESHTSHLTAVREGDMRFTVGRLSKDAQFRYFVMEERLEG